MNVTEFIERAKEYVAMEANTEVVSAEFVESFTLMGQDDIAISVKTTDIIEPEWWFTTSV